jgi:hypothetical protein
MKSVTGFQFNHVNLTAPLVILQDSYILSTLCNLSGYYDRVYSNTMTGQNNPLKTSCYSIRKIKNLVLVVSTRLMDFAGFPAVNFRGLYRK